MAQGQGRGKQIPGTNRYTGGRSGTTPSSSTSTTDAGTGGGQITTSGPAGSSSSPPSWYNPDSAKSYAEQKADAVAAAKIAAGPTTTTGPTGSYKQGPNFQATPDDKSIGAQRAQEINAQQQIDRNKKSGSFTSAAYTSGDKKDVREYNIPGSQTGIIDLKTGRVTVQNNPEVEPVLDPRTGEILRDQQGNRIVTIKSGQPTFKYTVLPDRKAGGVRSENLPLDEDLLARAGITNSGQYINRLRSEYGENAPLSYDFERGDRTQIETDIRRGVESGEIPEDAIIDVNQTIRNTFSFSTRTPTLTFTEPAESGYVDKYLELTKGVQNVRAQDDTIPLTASQTSSSTDSGFLARLNKLGNPAFWSLNALGFIGNTAVKGADYVRKNVIPRQQRAYDEALLETSPFFSTKAFSIGQQLNASKSALFLGETAGNYLKAFTEHPVRTAIGGGLGYAFRYIGSFGLKAAASAPTPLLQATTGLAAGFGPVATTAGLYLFAFGGSTPPEQFPYLDKGLNAQQIQRLPRETALSYSTKVLLSKPSEISRAQPNVIREFFGEGVIGKYRAAPTPAEKSVVLGESLADLTTFYVGTKLAGLSPRVRANENYFLNVFQLANTPTEAFKTKSGTKFDEGVKLLSKTARVQDASSITGYRRVDNPIPEQTRLDFFKEQRAGFDKAFAEGYKVFNAKVEPSREPSFGTKETFKESHKSGFYKADAALKNILESGYGRKFLVLRGSSSQGGYILENPVGDRDLGVRLGIRTVSYRTQELAAQLRAKGIKKVTWKSGTLTTTDGKPAFEPTRPGNLVDLAKQVLFPNDETGQIFIGGEKYVEVHSEGLYARFPEARPVEQTKRGIKITNLLEQGFSKLSGSSNIYRAEDDIGGFITIANLFRAKAGLKPTTLQAGSQVLAEGVPPVFYFTTGPSTPKPATAAVPLSLTNAFNAVAFHPRAQGSLAKRLSASATPISIPPGYVVRTKSLRTTSSTPGSLSYHLVPSQPSKGRSLGLSQVIKPSRPSAPFSSAGYSGRSFSISFSRSITSSPPSTHPSSPPSPSLRRSVSPSLSSSFSFSISPPSSSPPSATPPFIPIGILPGAFGHGRGRPRRGQEPSSRYKPSYSALILGRKARQGPAVLTGIEERPIIDPNTPKKKKNKKFKSQSPF